MGTATNGGNRETVVAAITDPADVEQVLDVATGLASPTAGRVQVCALADREATSPFLLRPENDLEPDEVPPVREVLARSRAYARGTSIPVECSIEIGTDPATLLRSTVRDHDADRLVLAAPDGLEALSALLERPPCALAVLESRTPYHDIETIEIHVDEESQAEPAAAVARAVGTITDATVRVVARDTHDRIRTRETATAVCHHLHGVDLDPTQTTTGPASRDSDTLVIRAGTLTAPAETASPTIVTAPAWEPTLVDRARDFWTPLAPADVPDPKPALRG